MKSRAGIRLPKWPFLPGIRYSVKRVPSSAKRARANCRVDVFIARIICELRVAGFELRVTGCPAKAGFPLRYNRLRVMDFGPWTSVNHLSFKEPFYIIIDHEDHQEDE